jgi:Flp pilus assembly protein TadB
MSPDYLQVLFYDPVGRKGGIAAIVMMIVGIIIITRMIRIKI